MVRLLPLLFAAALLGAPPSRSRAPEAVVQRQLEAYNAHDAEAFAATYAEDAELFDFPATPMPEKGRAALKAGYAKLFQANPDLRAKVKEQLVAGDHVIHLERVTGLAGRKEPLEALVIYRVRNGLIEKVWFLPPEAPKAASGH